MQVLVGYQASLLLAETGHLTGHVTLVEIVPGSPDGGFPAPVDIGKLHLYQPFKSTGQVFLHEQLAGAGHPSVGHENFPGGGPHGQGFGVVGQTGVYHRGHRIAVAGQLPGRSDDLLEGHGAVTLQGREPGVGGGGQDAAQYSSRNLAPRIAHVVVDVGGPGPAAQAAYGHHRVRGGQVDHDGRHAPEIGALGQQDVDGYPGGNPGVDGVAPFLQHTVPCRCRQVVAGRYHVGRAHDGGPVAVDADLVGLIYADDGGLAG